MEWRKRGGGERGRERGRGVFEGGEEKNFLFCSCFSPSLLSLGFCLLFLSPFFLLSWCVTKRERLIQSTRVVQKIERERFFVFFVFSSSFFRFPSCFFSFKGGSGDSGGGWRAPHLPYPLLSIAECLSVFYFAIQF